MHNFSFAKREKSKNEEMKKLKKQTLSFVFQTNFNFFKSKHKFILHCLMKISITYISFFKISK